MTDCNHIVVGDGGRVARVGGGAGDKKSGPGRQPRGLHIAHSRKYLYTYLQNMR